MKPIIEVKHLKKKYNIGTINTGTLINDLKVWWYRKVKNVDIASKVENEYGNSSFYALDDVSFDVYKGESIGILGSNGAGKSTLLKILSRVTSPTDGEAILRGRITSMLEVGTGFNPELTGRENIYLNGAILGMTTKEIDEKIDEIIKFSECEKFIDTPVKRYSSGMYVKLAFSVAAHLDSEIMIMDEVLAVGDVAFQRKCINKMIDSIKSQDKTVLYVSHNMATVESLCKRCIVLKAGKVIFDGPTEEAIAIYSGVNKESFLSKEFLENDLKNYGVFITKVELMEKNNLEFDAGEDIVLKLYWGTNDFSGDIRLGAIVMKGNISVTTSFTDSFKVDKGEKYISILRINTLNLVNGKYSINLTFCKSINMDSFYMQNDLFVFNIFNNKNQEKIDWKSELWGNTISSKVEMNLLKVE